MEELPLPPEGAVLVNRTRTEVVDILDRRDDRLVVVVGPCSVHDPSAALEYARRLAEPARELARQLLLDVVALGLPTGCEFLDPISPQFFADTVTWAAIGARTTESQVHRNLASGLSMPIGFKNGTGGGIQMAVDALRAAASPHSFLSVTEQGLAAIVTTRSNPDCHVVLRGGRDGPNYDADNVQRVLDRLRAADLPLRVMIDVSHDNSGKDYRRQPSVAREVAAQVAGGAAGIVGVMLESFLLEGRQDLREKTALVYGQSITDGCMGWETTVLVLRELAEAVQARRSATRMRGPAGKEPIDNCF
jgi:3-deoxy-7-phosphoheptulonate synthase